MLQEMIQKLSSDSKFNTLRPRQNGRHLADYIFKCIFLNENVWIPIKITLKFVPKGPFNNIPALVQIMAWRRPGDKPLSEPMMVSLTTHICVTRPQWVNDVFLGNIHNGHIPVIGAWQNCPPYSENAHLFGERCFFFITLIGWKYPYAVKLCKESHVLSLKQYSVGYNYLSVPEILASGAKVLVWGVVCT